MYSATTSRNQYGRYIVKLPLRSDPAVIGDSFQEALRRFRQIEKRLQRDVALQTNYNNFMKEYLSLCHMQMVEDITQSKGVRYFLPHHPVFREASTTTKLRVVFDASMKTDGGKGLSLNDILLVGPVVQDDLFSVIIRFRMHSLVFTADIVKMYRKIQVHKENTSLQSILWRSSPHQEIKVYELNTVTYGTAAAPYLATRTLNQIAVDCKDEYPNAENVIKDFYVDDILSEANTVEEAKKIISELNSQKGDFNSVSGLLTTNLC